MLLFFLTLKNPTPVPKSHLYTVGASAPQDGEIRNEKTNDVKIIISSVLSPYSTKAK